MTVYDRFSNKIRLKSSLIFIMQALKRDIQ